MATTPTLLVFTLGPIREGRRKRLLPAGADLDPATIFNACLDEALAAGRARGLRLVVASPEPFALPCDAEPLHQTGQGFGARLRGALGAAWSRARGPVVVVGTDAPGLGVERLGQALAHLATDPDRVVLGPSPDGGFYLLAVARPVDRALTLVRFCRRDTLRRLRAALAAEGRPVVLLPPLADLDGQADLEAWLARPGRGLRSAWSRLRRALAELLAALRRPLAPLDLGPLLPAFAPAPSGRSPPRIAP